MEAFHHPTGTIIHSKVGDTLVTVTRTPARDTCILAAPFREERTNIPGLGPQVDELPPLPDEVIYKVAAILHQHSEEESGSKRWPLDAMNTRHAAVTWLSTVGIGSIRVRRFARGWRPCNGGWDEVGRR